MNNMQIMIMICPFSFDQFSAVLLTHTLEMIAFSTGLFARCFIVMVLFIYLLTSKRLIPHNSKDKLRLKIKKMDLLSSVVASFMALADFS